MIAIPVLFVGGTEMQTLTLVRVLVAAGYRVTVCCYYEFDEQIVAEVRLAGAKVLLMHLDRSDGHFGLVRVLELTRYLVHLFRESKPDIVHVQYVAPGLIPILAAKIARVPTLFATVHQPGRVYGRKPHLFLRTAARLCPAFFCVSQSAEASWFGDSQVFDPELIPKGRKRFTIYNAVDVSRIARIVEQVDVEKFRGSLGIENEKVIGVVGRLRSEKGHAFLLDSMVEVLHICPKAILIVVGDGPDREYLMKRAEELGIARNVLWLGKKEPKEVLKLYSVMDLVVAPSMFEGFGLTAAEAMAAGRPVIGTQVDGLTEVIAEGVTGYLVPFGDTDRLAEAMIKLLADPEKAIAMGAKGRERVGECFSMERFAQSTVTAYGYFSE